MGTLVLFHAHPDDEANLTAGTAARAHAEGHRVVLVVATGGEHGEAPDDLADGESLSDRRRRETERSAELIGIDRVEWLGYLDSGMTGWEANQHDQSFWGADLDEAASRLAAVVLEEGADVLVHYDWHGNYGHPDHVQVNRVGVRAEQMLAEALPNLRVFEATMNRDEMRRQIEAARADGGVFIDTEPNGDDFDPDAPMDDGNPIGMSEAELTMVVDVSQYIDQKRAALAAHASQVTDTGFFLAMPLEVFAIAFGREWFIERGQEPGLQEGWLF